MIVTLFFLVPITRTLVSTRVVGIRVIGARILGTRVVVVGVVDGERFWSAIDVLGF